MSARYLGLIAGTSVDAVDAALVLLDNGSAPRVEAALSSPISDELRQAVQALGRNSALESVVAADEAVADAFSRAARALLTRTGRRPEEITAIGSHGQTVWHRAGAPRAASVQIGDPNRIAVQTGITTVADFRRRDIAAGGEGAPLASGFHAALLDAHSSQAAVLNLGGIANLTVRGEHGLIGFDCGPANALLDRWAGRHLGQRYDAGGHWAATGRILPNLLERLLQDPFLAMPPPKSTGPERFHLGWLDEHLSSLDEPAANDVQATLVELSARAVADGLRSCKARPGELLVCGGGVHNGQLMDRLRTLLSEWSVASTERLGIDPDYVEAAAFAWLAHQTLHHRTGNLPSVTGARQSVILGGIYPV